MNLSAIVRHYKRYKQQRANAELEYFRAQGSLSDAIRLAGYALTASGKRFSHQRRLPKETLKKFAEKLLASEAALAKAPCFDTLHDIVENCCVKGVGELTIYDTALRIGAKLKLEPNVVFLHAGTRKGAQKLKLNVQRKSIPLEEFRSPLSSLHPREIEDCLCIYKNILN